jgi:hypothetical protein
MSFIWKKGISWTKTHYETVYNPDGTLTKVRVQGGPFIFYRFGCIEFYLGFRPTAPWGAGYGNEGDLGTGWFGRLMKKIGLGNFGFALRKNQEAKNGS